MHEGKKREYNEPKLTESVKNSKIKRESGKNWPLHACHLWSYLSVFATLFWFKSFFWGFWSRIVLEMDRSCSCCVSLEKIEEDVKAYGMELMNPPSSMDELFKLLLVNNKFLFIFSPLHMFPFVVFSIYGFLTRGNNLLWLFGMRVPGKSLRLRTFYAPRPHFVVVVSPLHMNCLVFGLCDMICFVKEKTSLGNGCLSIR